MIKSRWNWILSVVLLLFLQGCASSDVSREAESQVNTAMNNASFTNATHMSAAESYQNSSQTTKGVLIGGATGAVAGSFTTGVGALPGAAGGAILGGALGAYIDSHTSLVDKLQNRGIKVIILGDQVLLVLPSRRLFVDMTPELVPYAYSSLDLVAQLISGYPNISVQVAGYTNGMGPERVNRALSQQQAESVARYLWRRGINTRMLYAMGYGGSKLVEKSDFDNDRGDNYRIEITLEKLPI